jgi:ornithine carbamoyltransferase
VWVSMGQDKERQEKLQALAPYRITKDLMSKAHPEATFMHCLPAHRGEEVMDEVIDGPQSVVWDQAENRLHLQKALLLMLLEQI